MAYFNPRMFSIVSTHLGLGYLKASAWEAIKRGWKLNSAEANHPNFYTLPRNQPFRKGCVNKLTNMTYQIMTRIRNSPPGTISSGYLRWQVCSRIPSQFFPQISQPRMQPQLNQSSYGDSGTHFFQLNVCLMGFSLGFTLVAAMLLPSTMQLLFRALNRSPQQKNSRLHGLHSGWWIETDQGIINKW